MTLPSDPLYSLIPLTQGQYAKVSPARYKELSGFKWCAQWSPLTKSYYAVRRVTDDQQRRKTILMHRQILGLDHGNPLQGDHTNHDTLDNTDVNLRVASRSQNMQNTRVQKDNKLGVKGISKHGSGYRVRIWANGTRLTIGHRKTLEEAIILHQEAAMKYHGAFANFD